jgi:hypothetical protein
MKRYSNIPMQVKLNHLAVAAAPTCADRTQGCLSPSVKAMSRTIKPRLS